ncbi:MAG: UDP-3-O-(3-hydroxymyristoyl)glucosamine N-acyltransferase [Acidobacteria bacterium]|nr:UDP-3-O-(3-hydroxymyristoyl)glucosamine N-acyltransferase [Acidobacteriota bacterium]
MKKTVQEIATQIGARIEGDASWELRGIAAPERAQETELIYVDSAKNVARASASAAACAVAPDGVELPGKTVLRHQQPKVAFAKAAALLLDRPTLAPSGIHPTAIVAVTAKIAQTAHIGPYVVIGENASVGDRSQIGPHTTIAADCHIGNDCRIHPRVTLYNDVRIGNRVEIHSGAVIGADGFGYAHGEGRHWKFPQAGIVEIGDDVEIGANTTIDRGSLDDTVIGKGVKLDNLVHIGHNCKIGAHTVIAALAGLSGSCTFGKNVVVGGQAGFGERCELEDGAVIGGQSGVLGGKVIRSGQTVWGTPARPLERFKEEYAWYGRLPDLAARIKELEAKVRG